MGMIDLKFDKLNYLETANFKHLSVLLCNIICFVKYCVFNPILYDNTFLWRLTSVCALYYFLESTFCSLHYFCNLWFDLTEDRKPVKHGTCNSYDMQLFNVMHYIWNSFNLKIGSLLFGGFQPLLCS